MKNEKNTSKAMNLIPALAKKVGERSADAACHWWFNQPKVPESMKKQK